MSSVSAEAPNSHWPYPRFIAHRGGGTLAPENTLAGFREARHFGFQGIETDVMLTADGAAVLSHDAVLGRVVKSSSPVASLTLKEIKTLDAGSLTAQKWAGERIPTLEEAIEACEANGLFMNIEIKPASDSAAQATAQETVRIVRKLFAGKSLPLLSSFSRNALAAAAVEAPEIPRGLLLEGIPTDWKEVCIKLAVKTVHPDWQSVTPDFVEEAHTMGLGVMCYTVDSPDTADALFTLGVDAVCTNRLDLFANCR